jgi:hypothetical protein
MRVAVILIHRINQLPFLTPINQFYFGGIHLPRNMIRGIGV